MFLRRNKSRKFGGGGHVSRPFQSKEKLLGIGIKFIWRLISAVQDGITFRGIAVDTKDIQQWRLHATSIVGQGEMTFEFDKTGTFHTFFGDTFLSLTVFSKEDFSDWTSTNFPAGDLDAAPLDALLLGLMRLFLFCSFRSLIGHCFSFNQGELFFIPPFAGLFVGIVELCFSSLPTT